MSELSSHRQRFLFKERIPLNKIEKSDIIRFVYGGEERFGLVLNPSWESKLHLLKLDNVTVDELVRLMNGSFMETPKSFYMSTLSKKSYVNDYRTFDVDRVSALEYVAYDYKIPTADPNTMIRSGKSIILTTDTRGKVMALDYRKIMMIVNKEIVTRGLYTSDNRYVGIAEFVSTVERPRFVRIWRGRRKSDESESDYEDRVRKNFEHMLSIGGVFLVSSRDLMRFTSKGLLL